MSKESALKTEKYSYNSQNRPCESIVIDRQNKTQAVSYYGYDAFGRRVVVQDRDAACMRSLYDGFTFDVIKQSPTLANGMFVDSNETGIRLNRTGRATGDRYRYLDDDKNDGNRYFYLDEGTYKSVSSRYVGERTSITVNGVVAAQNAGGEVSYFTTDLLGSVRSLTDSTGLGINSYTYDVFGRLVEGELSGASDYGYLGKQFDAQTGLYNYGYRDYAPEVARFTTVDPIRDGENWFAYVNNDPVNFVDLWGLSASDKPTTGAGAEFDTIEDAALDWANNYAQESIDIDREMGSFIYVYESEGDYKFSYTEPTVGNEHDIIVTAQMNEDQDVVSMIHSHGANDEDHYDDRPSQTDINGAGDAYHIFPCHEGNEYVVTPQGELIKFDGDGNTQVITSDLPKDPNL